MTGIKELKTLLSDIDPVLDKRSFIFCSFPDFKRDDIFRLDPIGFFHEKEGMTFIITKQQAIDNKINYESVYKLISLNVHSSLDAVGLTASFSTKLAEKNISANVIAAYFHDHIFVPEDKTEQALMAIHELQQ